jgi:hypothetical protein
MKPKEEMLETVTAIAKKMGIEIPVVIESALLEKLSPTPYLAALGISLEQRVENLLGMVKANLNPEDKPKDLAGEKYYLQFMVLKGPLVSEELFPVIARINAEEGDGLSITLTQAIDTDYEID